MYIKNNNNDLKLRHVPAENQSNQKNILEQFLKITFKCQAKDNSCMLIFRHIIILHYVKPKPQKQVNICCTSFFCFKITSLLTRDCFCV